MTVLPARIVKLLENQLLDTVLGGQGSQCAAQKCVEPVQRMKDVGVVDIPVRIKTIDEKPLDVHHERGNIFPVENVFGFHVKVFVDLPGDLPVQLVLAPLLEIVAGVNAADFLLPFGPAAEGADIAIDRRTEPVTLSFPTCHTFRHDTCHPCF